MCVVFREEFHFLRVAFYSAGVGLRGAHFIGRGVIILRIKVALLLLRQTDKK